MKFLQRLGKSLMLPVASLPACAILMGIGYWIDPSGWGQNNIFALFLIKAGAALIKNMGILFAISVGVGMAKDNDGTAAVASLVSLLLVQTLLAPETMALFMRTSIEEVPTAFSKLDNSNQFTGILCGIIGAFCYNRFRNTKLPAALSFFSGKRCVSIITAGVSLIAALMLGFVWPIIYSGLEAFGELILNTGAAGAGIYMFLNRLLIPFGLHHALNSVFWFDIAGISDIGKFWGTVSGGIYGQTGMYTTGFFPIMMFGIPGAALAMYSTAHSGKKKAVFGLYITAMFSSFFTGITEPFEFAFMFLAPPLYLLHALLTALSAFVCALLPVRSSFNFSAGFIDWLLCFRAPMSQNPLLIIPIGLIFGVLYYFLFRFVILKFNLHTPGREDDEAYELEKNINLKINDYPNMAKALLEGLGGKDNIISIDNCITRLRVEVKHHEAVREKKIKATGVPGVIRPGRTSVQIIIGTHVQFVTEEIKKLLSD